LLHDDNINDLNFDIDYYQKYNNINQNYEDFKKNFFNNKYEYRFGDMKLFKFDIIYCSELETFNFELDNRFISKKYYGLEFVEKKINEVYEDKIKNHINKKIIFVIPIINNITNNLEENISYLLKNDIYIISNNLDSINIINKLSSIKQKYSIKINFINLNDFSEQNIFKYFISNNIKFDYITFINSNFSLNKNIIKNINNEISKNLESNFIILRYSKNSKIIPDINCIEIDENIKYNICFHYNVLLKLNLEENIINNINNLINGGHKILISKYLINDNDYKFSNDEYIFNNFLINGNNYKMLKYIKNNVNFSLINLDNRKGRYISTIQELKKLNLNVNNLYRFSAIRPTIDSIINSNIIDLNKLWQFTSLEDEYNKKYVIGAAGCKFSHYELLKKINQNSKEKKYHMILEDDCLFKNNIIDSLYKSIIYFEENNIDFNMIYLGSNIKTKNDFQYYNDLMIKCNIGGCFSTHAILHKVKNINNTLKIIENSKKEIDVTFLDVNNRYVINPMIAIQRNDVSDISKFKEFHEGGKMWNKEEDGKIFYGDMDKIKFLN
jgi:hypothetical protein